MTIDSRIRLDITELGAPLVSELKSLCEYPNPEIGRRRAMGYNAWGIPDKIKTWAVNGNELSLPRGALEKFRLALSTHHRVGIEFDNRSEGSYVSKPLVYRGFDLREHQQEMVRKGMEHEQCIIRGATGSGKTLAAMALAAEIGLNTLIILPNKGLFDQWAEWAEKVFGINRERLGIIQGKTKRLRTLTIAMQATLGRGVSEDVKEFFGTVIVDETQRAAADSLYKAVDSMPAKYRIGVSASERRKDRKEFLTYDIFGKPVYEATRDAMTAAGHILDVEIRVIPTKFVANWYSSGSSFNDLLDAMIKDRDRNVLAFKFIDKELHRGEQAIILSHRRDHVRSIDLHYAKKGIPSGCLLGDGEPGDAEAFVRSKQGLQDGSTRVGVGTYGALGYGIDLPAVSVGMCMTPISNNQQNLNQVRGRLCRTNKAAGKTHGRLYMLMDFKVFGMKHLRNLVAWNKIVRVWSAEKNLWVDGRAVIRDRKVP